MAKDLRNLGLLLWFVTASAMIIVLTNFAGMKNFMFEKRITSVVIWQGWRISTARFILPYCTNNQRLVACY